MNFKLRKEIQAEFDALYSITDLYMFHKIKSFWAFLKITFFIPVYEYTVNFLTEVSFVLNFQRKFVQGLKPF